MRNHLNCTIRILWLVPGVCPSSWPKQTSTARLRKVGRREDPILRQEPVWGAPLGLASVTASTDPHKASEVPLACWAYQASSHKSPDLNTLAGDRVQGSQDPVQPTADGDHQGSISSYFSTLHIEISMSTCQHGRLKKTLYTSVFLEFYNGYLSLVL